MTTKLLIALVGMQLRPEGTKDFVASLPQGEPLTLRREPSNRFDPRAVQVWARGRHVGYLKGNQNKATSMAMDNAAAATGIAVTALDMPAKLAIDGGKWPLVEVET